MPIADWNVPMTLISPLGSLALNDPTSADGYFVVDNANCKSGPAVRSSGDDVPQGNGAILHNGFFGGYQLQMAIQYYVALDQAACATTTPTSDEMNDTLMRHLVAMINGGGRLIYQPSGGLNARLADQLQLFGTVVDLTEVAAGTGVTFTLESQLPYTIDYNQTETVLTAGSPTANLINTGTIPFLPVAKVYGPFDAFVLTNADNLDSLGNAKQLVYDDSLPGAVPVSSPDYIEFSFFHNTAYLNGNGASRKAGIDIILSDFFSLVVGDNHITVTSASTVPDVHFLWQPAWF